MKTKLIILVLSLLFTLIGCGTDILKEGEVCSKEYKKEDIVIMTLPHVVHINGKSVTMAYPAPYYYPDRYIITIQNFDDDGVEVIQDFYVDKEVYDSYKIGDYLVYDRSIMDIEEPKFEEYHE